MESDIEEKQITPDYHVIVINQNLEHWNIPEIRQYIEMIEGVWLFDRNSHTYMCELTPSYILHPVETRAVLRHEFLDDDTIRDKVHSIMTTWGDTDTEAHHCRVVDKWLEDGNRDFKRLTHTMEEDETKDEFFERVMEYCRCNSQI
jgi:hypothetical protein